MTEGIAIFCKMSATELKLTFINSEITQIITIANTETITQAESTVKEAGFLEFLPTPVALSTLKIKTCAQLMIIIMSG